MYLCCWQVDSEGGKGILGKEGRERKLLRRCLQVTNSAGKQLMILRADRRALYIQKSFPVNVFNKGSARLRATAAASYEGAS